MDILHITIIYFAYTATDSVSIKLLPPECVSEYAQCLKYIYLAKPPFPQPDWPPNEASEAAKLFIVSRSPVEGYSDSEIESQPDDYAHDKIDNIKGYKKEIELANILDDVLSEKKIDREQEKAPKPPRVLMDGAPGVGKTTLTIKACKDWAAGRLFKKYDLMILVPLRQPKFRRAKTVEDLCINCRNSEVIDHIFNTNGKNIAFIFDGYDELSLEQRQDESIYVEIIHGSLLPNCAVLVTSRPYASEFLQNLHKHSINRHIELVGFQKEQIFECVRKNITDQSKADKLIKQLNEREDIASLCYNPLNCVIVIYLYKVKEILFTTLNSLFRNFILEAVKRELMRNDFKSLEKSICDLDNLPKPYDQHLESLEIIAYKNLSNDRFIFNSEDFDFDSECTDVTANYFGLITSVNSFTIDGGENHFQFFHLSVQEYLAARYASKAFEYKTQIDLVQDYIFNTRYRLFLLFLVGNIRLSSKYARLLFGLVRKRRSDFYHNSTFFYLAHLIFETQNFDLYVDLLNFFCNKTELSFNHYKMTQFDCTLLAHFLCSINHSWEKLTFIQCSISLQSLNVFKQVYEERNSETVRRVTFKSIDFSSNDPEIIHGLHLFPWFNDVKEFTFTSKEGTISSETPDLRCLACVKKMSIKYPNPKASRVESNQQIVEIAPHIINIQKPVTLGEACVDHLKMIKEIKLTEVSYRTVQIIETSVQHCRVFALDRVAEMDLWIAKSSSMLCQSNTISSLKLNHTGLTCYGAASLFKSLVDSTGLKELDISYNDKLCTFPSQNYDVGYWLETMLSKNRHILRMQMRNAISDQLAQFLIAGLRNNSTLQFLNLDGNVLTTDTILCIINMTLHCNDGINKLYIEGHVLHLDTEKRWILKYNDTNRDKSQNYLNLLCAIPRLGNLNSLNYAPVTCINISKHLDTSICVRVLQSLQCNKFIKELKIDLSNSTRSNCSLVGIALKQMLLVNDVLDTLTCMLSCPVHKDLAAALEKNIHLKTLSLRMHSTCSESGISCVMKSLKRNQSIQKLQLLNFTTGDQSLLSTSDTLESDFQQLLISKTKLKELSIEVNDNYAIIAGICKGLHSNESLEKLDISLSSFKSFAVAEVLLSIGSSKLTNVLIHKFCSLSRDKDSEWNLVILNDHLMGPQLQYVFQQQDFLSSSTLKFRSLKFLHDHNSSLSCIDKLFIDSCMRNYRQLNVLELTGIWSDYLENAEIGKVIGDAIEKLLISSCLESLKLQSCHLPLNAWVYIAKGLRQSNVLKLLNVRKSNITLTGVIKIFESLRHNQSLKELNISGSLELTDEICSTDSHQALSVAIEQALMSNTSLESIDLADTINDYVTQTLAVALMKNKHIKRLRLTLRHKTYQTVHLLFKILGEARPEPFQLQLDSILFSQPKDHLCFYLIEKILSYFETSRNTCMYSLINPHLLYAALCNVIVDCTCKRNDHLLESLTEFDVVYTDGDLTNLIFRMMADTNSLLNVRKLSVHSERYIDHRHNVSTDYRGISGILIGHKLEAMLRNNNTLLELNMFNIDSDVVECIARGLQHNRALRKISLSLHDEVPFNYYAFAKLLHSISSNYSLVQLEIFGMPPITRVINSVWSFVDYGERNQDNYGNSLFPKFICMLNEICNGNNMFSQNCVVESLSVSLSKINLSNNFSMDIPMTVKLLQLLTKSSTCKELDLSKNKKLVEGGNAHLSEALESFLTNNCVVQALNVSESLNNTTANGLIAGLEHNETLKHLFIDAIILRIETIAKVVQLIYVKDFFSFEITDIIRLSRSITTPHLWRITIHDIEFWSQFILLLKEVSPSLAIFNTLDVVTNQKCLNAEFDSTCMELQLHRQRHNGQYFLTIGCLDVQPLRILSLSGIYITSDECSVLVRGIAATPEMQLQKLNVSYNYISESVLVELIDTLSTINSLEELDISNNCSGWFVLHGKHFRPWSVSKTSKFGCAIKRLLKSKTVSLKILNISQCGVTNAVCEYIGSGLQNNCILLCLNVSHNEITTAGIMVLLKSLTLNKCL